MTEGKIEILFFHKTQFGTELVVSEATLRSAVIAIPNLMDPKLWCDVNKDQSRFESLPVYEWLRNND